MDLEWNGMKIGARAGKVRIDLPVPRLVKGPYKDQAVVVFYPLDLYPYTVVGVVEDVRFFHSHIATRIQMARFTLVLTSMGLDRYRSLVAANLGGAEAYVKMEVEQGTHQFVALILGEVPLTVRPQVVAS